MRLLEQTCCALVGAGELAALMAERRLSEIRAAHEYLESNASFGKVVMTWS